MMTGPTMLTTEPAASAPGGRSIPHRRMILTTAVIVVVGALVIWLVAFSSVFGVRNVEVTGTHVLTPAQVRAVAAVAQGAPLLRLDTGAIQHRVEQMPDVASVKVSTSFPSTVRIAVTERIAVGAVKVDGGFILVDHTGYQYRTVKARPASLPVFVLPSGAQSRASGQAVATVATALGAQLRSMMSSIQAFDTNSITLLLRDGRVVAWGSATRSDLKARVLGALLRRPGHQFDLTNPAQPFSR